jgi:hypothetical protein
MTGSDSRGQEGQLSTLQYRNFSDERYQPNRSRPEENRVACGGHRNLSKFHGSAILRRPYEQTAEL